MRQAKKARPRLALQELASPPSDRATYHVPAPGFLLSLWALSLLLLAIAVAPGFVLSRAPVDLAERRGGLAVGALALAALPLVVLMLIAMTNS